MTRATPAHCSSPIGSSSLFAPGLRARVRHGRQRFVQPHRIFSIFELEPMIETQVPTLAHVSEKELRRQIDRTVSRALVDDDFARLLLADPTVVLEDLGCPPQQYKSL